MQVLTVLNHLQEIREWIGRLQVRSSISRKVCWVGSIIDGTCSFQLAETCLRFELLKLGVNKISCIMDWFRTAVSAIDQRSSPGSPSRSVIQPGSSWHGYMPSNTVACTSEHWHVVHANLQDFEGRF